MSMTYVLITGANRGIGKALTAVYLQRANHVVIATARNTEHATTRSLDELPRGGRSELKVVHLDSADPDSIVRCIKGLSDKGVPRLDVVIANAGFGDPTPGRLVDAGVDRLRQFFEVNTIGPYQLFCSTQQLNNAGAKDAAPEGAKRACFAYVSSFVGSFGMMDAPTAGFGAYGGSKAATNFFTKWLSFEHPEFNILAIHPGAVSTDMGQAAARHILAQDVKLPGALDVPEQADGAPVITFVTPEQSACGIQSVIDNATEKGYTGRFFQFDGKDLAW